MIKIDPLLDETSPTPGWRQLTVQRHRGGNATAAQDKIAEEWPVALVFNGISHAVMMTTPRDLEAFAVGFALSEGIISNVSEIRDVEATYMDEQAQVDIELLQGAFVALKDQRRTLVGRTGCGVCGIESLAMLDLTPEKIGRTPTLPQRETADFEAAIEPSLATLAGDEAGAPAPHSRHRAAGHRDSGQAPLHAAAFGDAAIQRAAGELRSRQQLMHETGGVHAAAWCAPDGEIRASFEDVGRHNALDKLIGRLALDRIDFAEGFVFLSSRASYELVRKAARVGIPMVATISAPTSLAVRIARDAGIRLASFCRDDGFVEYL